MTKEDIVASELFNRRKCLVLGSRVSMEIGEIMDKKTLGEKMTVPLIVTGVASRSDFIDQYVEIRKIHSDGGRLFKLAVDFPFFYFVEAAD